MTTNYIRSGSSVTFLAGGRVHSVDATHPNFNAVLDAIESDDIARAVELASPVTVIARAVVNYDHTNRLARGVVEVDPAGVKFNGEYVHNTLTERILQIASEGRSIAPWVEFATNLYQNPSNFAREELYLWLETSNLPITSEGHFLAFKRVSQTYKDLYTGSLDYSPGKVVTMPRSAVDPDRDQTCSRGLHFCSADYLPNFGNDVSSNNKVVLVAINPADVVSIPNDCKNTKGRAWRIEVIEDVTATYENILWPSVAGSSKFDDVLPEQDEPRYDDCTCDYCADDDPYDRW